MDNCVGGGPAGSASSNGDYKKRLGEFRFKKKDAIRITEELSERFGLAVDPTALVRTLSVGLKQRVEILKALAVDARILILDEPTAVLESARGGRLLYNSTQTPS